MTRSHDPTAFIRTKMILEYVIRANSEQLITFCDADVTESRRSNQTSFCLGETRNEIEPKIEKSNIHIRQVKEF